VADRAPALTYLNDLEARTVEAIAERIIPRTSAGFGATRAGVVYYIDRAISGFSTNLQRLYRLGLRELDLLCEQEFSAVSWTSARSSRITSSAGCSARPPVPAAWPSRRIRGPPPAGLA